MQLITVIFLDNYSVSFITRLVNKQNRILTYSDNSSLLQIHLIVYICRPQAVMYNLMFGTILPNFISTLLFVTSQHFNSHLNLRCFCLSCTNVNLPSIIIPLYIQQLAKLILPPIQNTIRIYKNVTSYFPPIFFYVVFCCCSCRYMSKKTHGGMIMRVENRKTRIKT